MTEEERLYRSAAALLRDELLEDLPEGPEHIFSEEFESGMEILLRQGRLKRPPWRRRFNRVARCAAVFVLVAFVGLSATILSVDAWRERLFEMVEQKFPEYSQIKYEPVDGSSADDFPEFDLVERMPTYLPEGYQLTDQLLNGGVNWCTFSNREGNYISYNQTILGTAGSAIDTEGSELVKCEVAGNPGHKMTNKGTQFILWSDSQYEYMLVTALPMDTAMRIAESVSVVPPGTGHLPKLEQPDTYQLPDDYSFSQAAEYGDVAVDASGRAENLDALEAFIESAAREEPAVVRVTVFNDQNEATIEDLFFDGFRVQRTTDAMRDSGSTGHYKEGTVGQHYDGILTREASGGDGEALVEVVLTGKGGDGSDDILCRYRA